MDEAPTARPGTWPGPCRAHTLPCRQALLTHKGNTHQGALQGFTPWASTLLEEACRLYFELKVAQAPYPHAPDLVFYFHRDLEA